jgi:hypothetical protein
VLVAWIGLKLVIGGLHNAKYVPFEMSEWIFWPVMLLIAVGSFLYQPKKGTEPSPEDSAIIEEVARIASGDDSGDEG